MLVLDCLGSEQGARQRDRLVVRRCSQAIVVMAAVALHGGDGRVYWLQTLGKGDRPMRERPNWRFGSSVAVLLLAALVTGCTGTTDAIAPRGAPDHKPHLQLSPVSGGPGTIVRITASSCPTPPRSVNIGPSLFFHDSYGRTKTGATLGVGLREPVRHQRGSVAEGTYQVRSDDSVGPGLFVIFCGSTVLDGNFTVT